GEVIRFPQGIKIPHMGWNQVSKIKEDILFQGIPSDSYFYFVHSYYVRPQDENVILGKTEYGLWFTSAIRRDNLYGVQFHPEKSQDIGLKLLSNFVQVVRRDVG
ncbi:MAG: imidazole glycerol phosphate synthase subunit HisH, partial [Candidatus Omnitrophica bacterium]|nr:imidazole glycerol phosphate synthase subunit HisH [Candidatus Omnitrophota bacterium]